MIPSIPPSAPVIACNCTICYTRAHMRAHVCSILGLRTGSVPTAAPYLLMYLRYLGRYVQVCSSSESQMSRTLYAYDLPISLPSDIRVRCCDMKWFVIPSITILYVFMYHPSSRPVALQGTYKVSIITCMATSDRKRPEESSVIP